MNAIDLKNHILKFMTADEALEKMLITTVEQFDNMKKNLSLGGEKELAASPFMIIVAAAMDLGWGFAVEKPEKPDSPIRGLVIGSPAYIDKVFQPEKRVKMLETNNEILEKQQASYAIEFVNHILNEQILHPTEKDYNDWYQEKLRIANG